VHLRLTRTFRRSSQSLGNTAARHDNKPPNTPLPLVWADRDDRPANARPGELGETCERPHVWLAGGSLVGTKYKKHWNSPENANPYNL
jgi:hypothetical protein